MNSPITYQRLQHSYVFNASMYDHYQALHQQYVLQQQWAKAFFARMQMNFYKHNLNTCHA